MDPRKKTILISAFVFMTIVVLMLAGVVIYLLVTKDNKNDNKNGGDNNTTPTINSFEDCKNANYPILETYPEQCKTPDGRTFVEDVPPIDTPVSDSTGSSGSTSTGTSITVKVYFSKNPQSYSDFNADFAVNRSTNRVDVGTFAIEQLIVGPTNAEKTAKYFTPVKVSGTSNCSGKDFSLNINKTTKKATLRFCKTVVSNGGGDDARLTKSVTDTLEQFPTVTSVVILTKDSHCFGDESGLDMCLVP